MTCSYNYCVVATCTTIPMSFFFSMKKCATTSMMLNHLPERRNKVSRTDVLCVVVATNFQASSSWSRRSRRHQRKNMAVLVQLESDLRVIMHARLCNHLRPKVLVQRSVVMIMVLLTFVHPKPSKRGIEKTSFQNKPTVFHENSQMTNLGSNAGLLIEWLIHVSW